MQISSFLLAAAPFVAPQAGEPFHFDRAPRWYDVSLQPDRPLPGPMAAIDLDGDGDLDVARLVANRLELLRNDAGALALHGSFDPFAQGYVAVDVARGDFDGDGRADLVLCGKHAAPPLLTGEFQHLLGDGAGGFAAQPVLSTGWNDPSMSVAAGDVDLDGRDDVLALDHWGDVLGMFTAAGGAQELPAAHELADAMLGDLTGDGAPELVSLEWAFPQGGVDGALELRTNDGSGGFPLLSTSVAVPAAQPFGLELGDVDLDGDLDVLTTTAGATVGTNLQLFANDGAGGLAPPVASLLSAKDWIAVDIDVELVDGDAKPDVVVSFFESKFGKESGAVVVARGDAAGAFTVVGLASLPAAEVAFGDVAGDGTRGLLTAGGHVVPVAPDGGIGVGGVEISSLPWPTLQTVLDFDGDGREDLATFDNGSQSLRVHLSDGEGGFSSLSFSVGTGTPFQRLEAADVDGDGLDDLVLDSPLEIVCAVNVGGDSVAPVVTDLTPLLSTCSLEAYDVVLGDLNGDGRADYVRGARHYAEALILFGVGGGHLAGSCIPLPQAGGGLAIGDVTGSGLADLVFVDRQWDKGLTVLPGDPATLFGPPIHALFPVELFTDLALGDVDGDGDLDAVASMLTGVAVLKNDGQGGFSLAQALQLGAGRWEDLRVVDMNGDGAPDVVARHVDGYASFRVFENVGGVLAAGPVAWDYCAHGSFAAGSTRIDVGDVDADGFPDVLAAGALPDAGIDQPLVFHNRSALRGSGLAQGGHAVELAVDLPGCPGSPYAILASHFGTWPGLPIPGGLVPLNPDPALFHFSLTGAGGTLTGFVGVLDASGRADAQIAVSPGLPVPLELDFAAGALDLAQPGLFRTTNSWGTTFQ